MPTTTWASASSQLCGKCGCKTQRNRPLSCPFPGRAKATIAPPSAGSKRERSGRPIFTSTLLWSGHPPHVRWPMPARISQPRRPECNNATKPAVPGPRVTGSKWHGQVLEDRRKPGSIRPELPRILHRLFHKRQFFPENSPGVRPLPGVSLPLVHACRRSCANSPRLRYAAAG